MLNRIPGFYRGMSIGAHRLLLDKVLGSTRGSLAIRGATGWTSLIPGATSGHVLKTNGTGADPSYSAGGAGDLVAANNLSDVASAQTSRANLIAASVDAGSGLGKIFNPFFEISQENGTTLLSALTSTPSYPADRFYAFKSSAGTLALSTQNVVTPFSGTATFKRLLNSQKTIATTAQAVLGAADAAVPCRTIIEGRDFGPLGWGGGDARDIVVVGIFMTAHTGTIPLTIRNGAGNRSYVRSVACVANTPTVLFELIPADTSGTWATDNTAGCEITLGGAAGSTFQIPSLDTWTAGGYITHSSITNWCATINQYVQVAYLDAYPVGVLPWASSAQITSEALQRLIGARRPASEEERLCRRYFRQLDGGIGKASSSTTVLFAWTPENAMRTAPSATAISTTIVVTDVNAANFTAVAGAASGASLSSNGGFFSLNGYTGLTSGGVYFISSTVPVVKLSARL
jgi:hypothetical protein